MRYGQRKQHSIQDCIGNYVKDSFSGIGSWTLLDKWPKNNLAIIYGLKPGAILWIIIYGLKPGACRSVSILPKLKVSVSDLGQYSCVDHAVRNDLSPFPFAPNISYLTGELNFISDIETVLTIILIKKDCQYS